MTVGVLVTVVEGHLIAIDSKALDTVASSNAGWQEAKVEVVTAKVGGGFVDRVCIPSVVVQANE